MIIDTGDGIETTYRRLLQRLIVDGDEVAPRGLATRSLRNVVMEFTDVGDVLLTGIGRGLSLGLLALEPLQLVGGFSDPELTVAVVPRYAQFMENGRFHGAYGVRTGAKVAVLADRLKTDPHTRQAYMTYWDDRLDLEANHRDYPCTVGAHFQIGADGKLHGTTTMRSNDAWLGFPYDLVQHTTLLKSLARFIGVDVGTYTHVVHNMHIYATDFESADRLLSSPPTEVDRPRLDGGIGRGDETAWWQVQQRARLILNPSNESVIAASSEETWYLQAVSVMTCRLASNEPT